MLFAVIFILNCFFLGKVNGAGTFPAIIEEKMYFAGVLYYLICTTDGNGSHFTNRFMYQGRGHIFDGMANEFRVRTALSSEYDEYPFPGRYGHRISRQGAPIGNYRKFISNINND